MITFNKIGLKGFGRLGNQMFQYSLIVGVAKKLNLQFGVPLKNKSEDEYANFYLDEGFEISASDSSKIMPKHTFIEKGFNFDCSVFEVEDNTDFVGFFQSEKYFNFIEKEIRNEFRFKDRIIEKSDLILRKFSKPLVSVCVRRGDYLIQDFKKIHYSCGSNYFFKCLKEIPQEFTKIIFSDDYNWVSKQFSDLKNSIVLKQNLDDKDNKFVMLKIMSECDFHVLSNSSYCWWGAWLCKNKNKKVFAPKKWFNSAIKDWRDIYCEDWSIVDNSHKNFL